MLKSKILIYSDCYIYGGSERLMSFLLKNRKINDDFELVFAFRNHKKYKKDLFNDFKNLNINNKTYPLFILSNATFFYKLNTSSLPTFIKNIIKLPFWLMETTGLYFLFNFLYLFFFIKKIQPKAVHINNGGYPGAASCNHFVFAAKANGINPILYQVNNIAFPAANYFSVLLDKLINKYVSYFITASEKAGNALTDKRKFSCEKMVKIANTIPLENITEQRATILENLGWQNDCFLLVQVAFLTNRKGQFYLLKAISEIIENKVPGLAEKIKLILIGSGEDEFLLRKYVAENNLADVVSFAGYRLDSINYINACDVFMLPSIANEDMPLSLLTAMSLGKPIISTRFAGIAEAIKDNKNGLLIDPLPEILFQKLYSAIMDLYNNSSKRSVLSINAKISFNKKYSEEIYARKIVNLYNVSLNKMRILI